jgi:hypothetical protein
MSPSRGRRAVHVQAFALACACLSGCVERRYTIRSNPPGAMVIVNGEEVGPTPVSRSFTYYGTRKLTLMADGYETMTVLQPVKAPWYDNNFTDWLTENFVPFTIRDERDFTYTLAPKQIPDPNDLVNRGQQLRNEGQVPPKPLRGGILGFLGFP